MFFNAEIREPDKSAEPTCIVGSGALACFLAARLIDAGENPALVADPGAAVDLSTNGVVLRDDRSLSKTRYRLNASFMMAAKPKLVLVAAGPRRFKSLLSALSPAKIGGAPILLFSYLHDIKPIRDWLGKGLHQAFLDGYVGKDGQTVSTFGRGFSLAVCARETEALSEALKPLDMPVGFEESRKEAFWRRFAPFAAGSALSAALDLPMAEILKDAARAEKFKTLCAEVAQIAAKERVSVEQRHIVEALRKIPEGYDFPLRKAVKARRADGVDIVASPLLHFARKHGVKIPLTQQILLDIYKKAL